MLVNSAIQSLLKTPQTIFLEVKPSISCFLPLLTQTFDYISVQVSFMSLPQGYVRSLLHYPYFLSQVRLESVRMQTLRTVGVEGLVWVERWGLDTFQKAMDQSLQTHTQKRDTWWKLYFSSSAFHVNDFNAKFLGLNAAHHKKPCWFNVSSCNFGPALFLPPPLTAWTSICLWGAWKIDQWHCSNRPMQSVLRALNERVLEKTRLRTIHFT